MKDCPICGDLCCEAERPVRFYDPGMGHGVVIHMQIEWCPSCEYHEILNTE